MVIGTYTGYEISGDGRKRDVGAVLDVVYVIMKDHFGGLGSPVGYLDRVSGSLFLDTWYVDHFEVIS